MNQSLAPELAQVMPAAVATGLFVSRCTVKAPNSGEGPSGAPIGGYTDVAGLVAILCMDAPEPFGAKVGANEQKTVAQIESQADRHVLLDDYYSLLSPGTNWGDVGWIAVIDGVEYDLIGAECDSQRTQSRLSLCKVTT